MSALYWIGVKSTEYGLGKVVWRSESNSVTENISCTTGYLQVDGGLKVMAKIAAILGVSLDDLVFLD